MQWSIPNVFSEITRAMLHCKSALSIARVFLEILVRNAPFQIVFLKSRHAMEHSKCFFRNHTCNASLQICFVHCTCVLGNSREKCSIPDCFFEKQTCNGAFQMFFQKSHVQCFIANLLCPLHVCSWKFS